MQLVLVVRHVAGDAGGRPLCDLAKRLLDTDLEGSLVAQLLANLAADAPVSSYQGTPSDHACPACIDWE